MTKEDYWASKKTRAERRTAGEGVYRVVEWWNSSTLGIEDYPRLGTRCTRVVPKMSKKERRKA